MEHITLFYLQGSSDKVYQASIESKDGGYVVNFAYGRRGQTLNIGTKTTTPVEYSAAKAIYDKLIREKMAKGYTPVEDGTTYSHTDKNSTGIHCQLLNSVEEADLPRLIADCNFCLQEKHDGRRTLIRKNGSIEGINRHGLIVSLPESLKASASRLAFNCLIDGEAVGEHFVAFDLLSVDDDDIRAWGYRKRLFALNQVLIGAGEYIIPVQTATETDGKSTLLEKLKQENREGVVFKRLDAVYSPGRPASGGDQLKYKFVTTASFIVGKANNRRSIGLLLFEGDRLKTAGNVSIPANHVVPKTGQVVECRYLYAFRESGSIYQPVYLGVRDDIIGEECTTAQLKFKAEPNEQAA